MSTEPLGGDTPESEHDERTRYIREAAGRLGRPPTARQAASHTPRGHDWMHPDETTWDTVLREAGVPGYDEVVARALQERYERRYPWQEFVVVRAAEFVDELRLGPSHIGQKIGEIADGERTPPAADGLCIERTGTGSGHANWVVRADE